jgi:hypothetical protein
MPLPYSEPRRVTTYVIIINSREPIQCPDAIESAKLVADNLLAGKSATVVFENAPDLQTVRQSFNIRVDDALRKLGHNTGFGYEATALGANYRPK